MPHTGQAGINQLGGIFVNGRPLPEFIRKRIVILAEMGVRPCEISRQLLVSHGCVSKILSRYYETGSISPGSSGGAKLKALGRHRAYLTSFEVSPFQQLPYLVNKKILQLRQEHPEASTREIRDLLIYYRVYEEISAPSLNSISRVLRDREGTGGSVSLSATSTTNSSPEQPRKPLEKDDSTPP